MSAADVAGFVRQQPEPAPIGTDDLVRALEVAHEACDRARPEILSRFRRVAVETKRDGSPVTEADRAAERAIRSAIEERFADDAILGEEYGASRPGARRCWVVDPIDGTIAFSRGIPLFTTLIALLVDGRPVLGVIDLPAFNDRIGGFCGGGVWRGTHRLQVRSGAPLDEALVCHGDLFCFEAAGLRPTFDALARRVRTLRGYTDAFGHLLVLSGAADAMIDCDLNPWDAAVTRALAPEAGGDCWVRERDDGQKLDLVFGDPALTASMLELATTSPDDPDPAG